MGRLVGLLKVRRGEERRRAMADSGLENKKAHGEVSREVGVTSSSVDDNPKLQQLQSQLDRANSRVQELKEENEKTKKALAAAAKGIAAEASHLEKIENEGEARKKQLKQMEGNPERANEGSVVSELQSTSKSLQAENENIPKAPAAATAAASTASAADAVEIQRLREENESLQNQLETVNNQTEKTSSEQAAMEIKRLRKEIESLQKQLDNEKEILETAQNSHRGEIEKLEEASRRLKEVLAAQDTTGSAVEVCKIKDLEQQVAELQNKNDALSRQLEEAKDLTDNLQCKIEQLEEENHETKTKLAGAAAATSAAAGAEAASIKCWQDLVSELHDKNDELVRTIEENQEQKQRLECKLDEIETVNRKIKSAVAAAITAAVATASVKVEDLEDQLSAFRRENEELKDRLSKMHTDASRDPIQEEVDGTITVDSRDPPSMSEETSAALRIENEQLKLEIERIKIEYSERLADLEETEESIQLDLAAKINELHYKNEKRKEALAVATSKLSHDNAKLHELQRENEALQDRIHELEDENAKQMVALVKATLHSDTSPRSVADSAESFYSHFDR